MTHNSSLILRIMPDDSFPTKQIGDLFFSDVDAQVKVNQSRILSYQCPENVSGNKSDIIPTSRGQRWLAERWWKEQVPSPGLSLFSLHGAHVYGGVVSMRQGKTHEHGQLLITKERQIFSQSYGIMDGSYTLPSDLVRFDNDQPYLAREDKSVYFSGSHIFLGSLHRHFGHVIVEGLSRIWGYFYLPETQRHQLKFLVYEPELQPFTSKFLGLLGIHPEQIVHCPTHAIVEHLIVPTPSMRTHWWIMPEQAETWERIAKGVELHSKPKRQRRIYLSRINNKIRPLDNERQVIEIFKSAGFEIVIPEALSIEDQIGTVRNADIVAGCVGSNMYLTAFRRAGGKTLVIAPRNFFLKDDVLISSVQKSELSVVFGTEIDFTHTKTARSWHVDLDHVRESIISIGC